MSPTSTGTVVPMPHMGVSIEEGTITVWQVAVGDAVAEGDVLCEIATDKVDMEVESPAAGTVTAIFAEADGVVPVGEAICELDGDGTAGGEGGASAPSSGDPAPGVAERAAGGRDANGGFDPAAAADAVTSLPGDKPLASPLAKRIASKRGVDLNLVTGTGKRGRIRKADVLAAAEAGPAAPAAAPPQGIPAGYEAVPHEIVPTSRVRQAIAEHMIRSRQTAAHMTTETDVDLSAVIRARTELNKVRLAAGDPKLSFLPFIARATCAALREYPDMNATFQGTQTIRWGQVNLGIAVDTDAGLLVPVIPDAGSLTAPAIGAAIADLAARARDRKLVPDDLGGGTFTISNPGSVGAVSAPAIINQPQVAILGVPTIQRRPWVVTGSDGEEMIAIRSILRLAVTFDHRAVDGADATRFAVAVKDRLESWSTEAYA
jgi:pyruvate dehydrogenase E2 component (dihydrolipoamide acetyltransferase)